MGPNAGFKTRLMRAIHAEARKRGIDHDGLHDLFRERCGVHSMSQATGEQLYSLYHSWTGKGLKKRTTHPGGGEKLQMVSGEELIELAEEFAKRGWGQQTQGNFIRRQLRGRDVVRTRGDLRKVLFAVREMNRRDAK